MSGMKGLFASLLTCLLAFPAGAVSWVYCDGPLAGTAIPNNILGGLASSSDTSQSNETIDACALWPAGTSSAASPIFLGRSSSCFFDPAIATAGGCAGTCRTAKISRCVTSACAAGAVADILGVPIHGDDGVSSTGPCVPPTDTNCDGPQNATITGIPAGVYSITISAAPTSTDTAEMRCSLTDALWPPRP